MKTRLKVYNCLNRQHVRLITSVSPEQHHVLMGAAILFCNVPLWPPDGADVAFMQAGSCNFITSHRYSGRGPNDLLVLTLFENEHQILF